MHRSGCYGTCSVYTVDISHDGRVTYKGERFVSSTGEHTGTASVVDLARLDRELTDVGFFSLREHYQSGEDGCTTLVKNNPTVSILVSAETHRHQVTYYYRCTLESGPIIVRLSQLIDEVARTRRWVGHGAL
jgi:hypothetical protein